MQLLERTFKGILRDLSGVTSSEVSEAITGRIPEVFPEQTAGGTPGEILEGIFKRIIRWISGVNPDGVPEAITGRNPEGVPIKTTVETPEEIAVEDSLERILKRILRWIPGVNLKQSLKESLEDELRKIPV